MALVQRGQDLGNANVAMLHKLYGFALGDVSVIWMDLRCEQCPGRTGQRANNNDSNVTKSLNVFFFTPNMHTFFHSESLLFETNFSSFVSLIISNSASSYDT